MGLFGGSTKTQHQQKDTLFSDDIMEVVLAVSEGPIIGLENGPSSFYVGDTPLVNSNYTPNLGNFDLRIHKGNNPGESFTPNLGGSGSTVNLNVTLDTNLPVVGAGTKKFIDYIEVRVVIQRLYATNARGEWPWWATWKVEVKPHSSGTWEAGISNVAPAAQTDYANYTRYTGAGQDSGEVVNPYYRPTIISGVTPAAPADFSTIWFNSSSSYAPKVWNGSAWVSPPSLTYVYAAAPSYSYYTWSDGEYVNGVWSATNVTRKAIIGWQGATPTFGAPQDLWVTPTGVLNQSSAVSYVWNGSSWVDYMSWNTPVAQAPGVINIYGKTSSSYVKEIRIPVPRINDTYDVRVTKLSTANTATEFSDIMFESFQEVTVDPLQFDDLAIAHLTVRASDQFSSIPQFTGVYKGRVIRVPAYPYYNTTTRAYTGIWDGVSFDFAYTDNPAWIIYDLVTNTRYGMAAYYTVNLDKMAVYAFAKHCDQHGFTYNELIQEPRNLVEAIDYICGIAGGRFVDLGNGYATILFDADDQPAVALFTPENVVDGVFSYAFTDITSRKNDITVSFINPELNWREDRRRVYDQTAINTYGRNPEEFIAVGCISETEAIKRARLRLIMAQTERAVITFKTNRAGLYLRPFDIILVADDTSGFGIHGRVKTVVNSTTLTLRDPVYFEAGFTYTIRFQVPDGNGNNVLVQHLLTTSGGTTSTLTLASPLTVTLPAQAAFSIECATTTVGTPKAFRVTSIEEGDGDPDAVTVSAMEVNRTKWAFVDGAITSINAGDGGRPTRFVDPPTNAIAVGRTVSPTRQEIAISWDPSPNEYVRHYNLYWSFNAGQTELLGTSRTTVFVVEDVVPGVYSFGLTAVSYDGVESSMLYFEHRVTALSGANRAVTPPSSIQLMNGSSLTQFRGREPEVTWGSSADPFFLEYNVRVLHPTTYATLREFTTRGNTYKYPYLDNTSDFGGTPSRSMIFEVRAVDSTGAYSAPVSLTASNPTPSIVTPTISTAMGTIVVSFDAPADADIVGSAIWISSTSGFNPLAVAADYEGPNTSATFYKPSGTYYVRVGVYDSFGRLGMLISPETIVTTSAGLDSTPPATPTGGYAMEGVQVKPDGTVDSTISVSWNANTESDLAGYYIQIKEGSGNYIEFETPSASYVFHNLTAGKTYTIRVCAYDKSLNRSGYISFSVDAIGNTSAPGSVTGLTATAALKTVFLTWTSPTNADLAYVEVYANTTNSQASSTRVAKVNGTAFTHSGLNTGQTYYYWVRPVNTSGVAGSYTGSVSAAPGAVTSTDLGANSVSNANLVSGLTTIEIVSSLPTSGNYTGRTVYLTTDSKLYRYNGSSFIRSVDGADINNGSVDLTKFASNLTAVEIVSTLPTSGNFVGRTVYLTTDSKLYRYNGSAFVRSVDGADINNGTVDLTKFASNLTAIEIVSALPTSGNWTGRTVFLTTDQKIYRYNGSSFTTSVSGSDITDGSVSLTKFASGLTAIEIVSTLPTTGNYVGRTVYLTTDQKTYRYNGTAFTAAVDGGDITNGSVNITKFASGLTAVEIVSTLPGTGNYVGRTVFLTTDAKLYRWNGSGWTKAVDGGDITAHSITAGQIQAGAISATEIAAGAITTEKLAVGSSRNMAPNSDARAGTETYFIGWNSNGVGCALYQTASSDWYPPGMGSISLGVPGTPPAGYIDVYQQQKNVYGGYERFPITPGQKYELTTYMSVHRCYGQIVLDMFDSSGARVAWAAGNELSTNYSSGPLEGWGRTGIIVTAPANAVTAQIVYRMRITGTDVEPYIIWTGVYFGKATAYQTEYSPYVSSGQTIISGTQLITGSVAANKIVANSITAGQIQAGAISATELAAGAITTAKLAVGSPRNIVYNSDCRAGTSGYTPGWNQNNVTFSLYENVDDTWRPPGMGSIALFYPGTPVAGYFDVYAYQLNSQNSYARYPVTPGERYEFTAYMSVHRCYGSVRLCFYDSAGTYISEVPSNELPDNEVGGPLEYWPRTGVFGTAPANAVTALLVIRCRLTGTQLNPYLFWTGVYFGKANANQTEFSPFVPSGQTVITGSNIATNSIQASKIVANSITAGQIQAGAISATELAAGAITTAKLAVGSPRNIIPNADCRAGSENYVLGWNQNGVAVSLFENVNDLWRPPGMGSIAVVCPGTPVAGVVDSYVYERDTQNNYVRLPVAPGQRYELTTYMSVHRCYAEVIAVLYDSSGNYVSEAHGNEVAHNGATGPLEGWGRSGVFFTAPANSATALIILRTRLTGTDANPGVYWTGVYFGKANPNQTEYSPFVPAGQTVITGSNIATNSIQASKIVANSITAGQIQAGAISATELAAGAITTAKLAVGSARNMVYNSDARAGTDGYVIGWNQNGVAASLYENLVDTWRPPGMGSVALGLPGTPVAGYIHVECYQRDNQNNYTLYPITAGQRYELTAYLSVHRCYALIGIAFFDSSGTYVAEIYGNELAHNGSNGPLENWGRSGVLFTAPANAAKAFLIVRTRLTGTDASPYVYVTGVYLGKANANQTEYSPYVASGQTVVTGSNIATNSVNATKIVAGSITADKIASSAITADKIQAGAVSAAAIQAYSITASKLALVDNTVLGPDPGFYDLAWWGLTGYSGYTPATGTTSVQPYRFLQVTRLGNSDVTSERFQVEQGAYYRIKLRLYIAPGTVGWIGLSVHVPWTAWAVPYPYTSDEGIDSGYYPIIDMSNTTVPTGQWLVYESIVQASASQANYLQFRTRHNLSNGYFEFKWEVTRAMSANLIVDGAVTADKIQAGAISTNKLNVGLGQNLINNSDCRAGTDFYQIAWNQNNVSLEFRDGWDPWRPTGMGSVAVHCFGTPVAGVVDIRAIQKDLAGNPIAFPASPGQRFELTAHISVHRCYAQVFILFLDDANNQLSGVYGNELSENGASGPLENWPRSGVFATAPSGTTKVIPYVRMRLTGTTYGTDPYIFLTGVYFGIAMPNQVNATPYAPAGQTIINGTQIITGSIVADRIAAGTITGDKISTSTSLPGTITVGSTGVSIGTIESRAADPAARINAASTTIDPGKILISGGTTLSSWRNGSDATKIEGGSIAANTITANKLRIGARGINTVNLDFTSDKYGGASGIGRISWTGGYILYEDDAGNQVSQVLNAGYYDATTSSYWSYIYWTKGTNYLSATTDWAAAQSGNNVLMASYTAGAGVAAMYGGTIIDGTRIVTGSITADRLSVTSLSAMTANMGTLTAGKAQSTDGKMVLDLDNKRLTISD